MNIAVGLSGGVDSSVAAFLLKEQGHTVYGITMRIWDDEFEIAEGARHACFGPGEEDDIARAGELCGQLGIKYSVIDLRSEFRDTVLSYFKEEYLAGRTPNPCIVCNRRLKFGFLVDRARAAGLSFDYFATGHYARIVQSGGNYYLKKALHLEKDQSYFLYGIPHSQLSQILFPLGALTKNQVRDAARIHGIATADLPESQDFIAGGDYSPLFKDSTISGGDIVDEPGSVLGHHDGIIHYTVGQRRGLGVSAPQPLYVKSIDPVLNRVTVASGENLFSQKIIVRDINYLLPGGITSPQSASVRIRQKHREAPAEIVPLDRTSVSVLFEQPVRAVALGQSAVFYDGDAVLGGGIITEAV